MDPVFMGVPSIAIPKEWVGVMSEADVYRTTAEIIGFYQSDMTVMVTFAGVPTKFTICEHGNFYYLKQGHRLVAHPFGITCSIVDTNDDDDIQRVLRCGPPASPDDIGGDNGEFVSYFLK